VSEILIVDDERQTRELLSLWLKAEGFTISEAADADSALKIIADKRIAVATIDKDMPGHDGTWLVEQIQKQHPAVAMLLATGDDQIAPRVSLSRGIQGYLVKPFKRELVVGAVKDAVQWHQVAAKSTKPAAGPDPVDTWLQGRAGRPPKND
jgi:DNA-binding NtrC family response regulator